MEPEQPSLCHDQPPKAPRPLFRWFVMYPLFGLLAAALLASLCVPSLNPGPELRRRRDTLMDLIHLHAALDTFHADTHRYPTTAEGLEALVTPPQGVDGWHGPYIEKVQPDKWGHPYRYTFPNPEKPATFDLHSVGGDGIDGTDDDVYEAAE